MVARNLDFEPGLAKAAAQVAIDRLTTPYGYGQIARIFARMALGIGTGRVDVVSPDRPTDRGIVR